MLLIHLKIIDSKLLLKLIDLIKPLPLTQCPQLAWNSTAVRLAANTFLQ